ncbi:protein phosphatase 1 regulatory subunit 42-like isoform X3 [Leptopilina boulardi]|uniref:protein phosphatase 1 regulatory subunit 42-like isoform X3 n=1 Tax=Leptopilina boulardi TaxID=63433 RepID=UPI0021F68739|nr:protein phosphatase 1 regulatory subunit 42-like isoform X3 [Leptopilina boulardi]XP_051174866.1 protein phosphatase 1 regulatory subunit 42-like isoform X3 [Leptopilina boulardi]XP_051174867.1 protein phosphatase 1 regulatory subunit 42-like isoform X3 [Leptopilina boulardi]
MVTLTTAFVEKKCSETQSNKSLTKEIDKDHVKKMTHLFMNYKSITDIGNFVSCENLKIIYLQNNEINKIENLHFANNLSELYLQHNNLTKIENLDSLRNLKKLYLGYNKIAIVEGLENLASLRELYIEKQRLSPGESLCFEPRSCLTLATCLQILNVSGNRIYHFNDIRNLTKLQVLEAKYNLLKSIKDLIDSIKNLPYLQELFLQGNPVTTIFRYRANIIGNHDKLALLDGKIVSENSRNFMKKLKIEKQLQETKKKFKIIEGCSNTSPVLKQSTSKAVVSQHVGSELFPLSNTSTMQFQSWKASINTLPRPFWISFSKSKCEYSRQLTLPFI